MGVSKRVRACPRFSSRVICGLFIQPLFLSQAFFLSSAHATPQCSTTDNESQCVGTITSTCTDTAPVSAGGASGFGCPDTAEFAAALAAALAPPQSAADKALARAMIDYMHAVDAQANALEASLAQP